MKKKLRYMVYDKEVEREINYIPVRFIIAVASQLILLKHFTDISEMLRRYDWLRSLVQRCTHQEHNDA